MSDNHNEPILPIPSELYTEIGKVEDRVRELRRDVRRLRNRYAELRQSPQSLRVDNLGKPMEPREAVEAAYQALDAAEFNLDDTSEAIGWAHSVEQPVEPHRRRRRTPRTITRPAAALADRTHPITRNPLPRKGTHPHVRDG